MTNNFSPDDIFSEATMEEQSGSSKTAMRAALWALHLAHVALLIYSAAHGISAVLKFTGTEQWQKVAAIVGIVVTEAVMQALYVAALNRGINGDAQRIVAAITYLIGLILSSSGILVDSQLNAGRELTGILAAYLFWGLPIAPVISGVGATLVHLLEPEQARQREQATLQTKLETDRFKAQIAIERSSMEEEKALAALRVMSRKAVIQELYSYYTSEDIQEDIRKTAKANLPELLRGAGVMSQAEALPDPAKREREAPAPAGAGSLNGVNGSEPFLAKSQ